MTSSMHKKKKKYLKKFVTRFQFIFINFEDIFLPASTMEVLWKEHLKLLNVVTRMECYEQCITFATSLAVTFN